MTHENKHTPAPWVTTFEEGTPFFHGVYQLDKNGFEGEAVTYVTDSTNHQRAQANAEHIVKCVNLHDELLEALEHARDCLPANCHPDDLSLITEAIAKARGQ